MQQTRTVTCLGRIFLLTAHRWPEGDYIVSYQEQGGRGVSGPGHRANTAQAALDATAHDFATANERGTWAKPGAA